MSTPKITLIGAMSESTHAIGIHNTLPWHLPADLQHFKSKTSGKPILMGRKTYDSIGRALPNRLNIVISRDVNLKIPGCKTVNSIEQAMKIAENDEELMVIGGGSLYEKMLDKADRLVLTFIDIEVEADAFFPKFNSKDWRETTSESHQSDEKNPYNYRFVTFERT